MNEQQAGYFPTTNWSLVGHAGASSTDALDDLLRTYWPALKAHLVCKRRIDANDADDLLQAFIENKILERNLIASAQPTRGKFRSLLLKSLDNFALSQRERKLAKKRAPDNASSINPVQQENLARGVTPDKAFDVEWARQLLNTVITRMKDECESSDRRDLWGIFEGRILAPHLSGAEPLGYQEIVDRFKFATPTQASNALVTAKRMFVRLLRQVVSEYTLDPNEIDMEIAELERSLSYCERV